MRLLPGYPIAFVVALLLICTTPVGTGAGVHQFDLVHPVFSHVHIINGRALSHEQMQQAPASTTTAPSARPAFSIGGGPNLLDGGFGLSPTTVPLEPVALVQAWPKAPMSLDARVPSGRRDSPPDPPPDPGA
jgi:hypothetical protein